MCGIAGWFSRQPLTPDAASGLKAMVESLRHRGPDGSGQALRRHAALGHTRLAIIDVAGGAQPMFTPDEKVIVVFNGEIYNFRELRTDLERSGAVFRSHSDTEVLLHLYRRDGWQGFSRLRGMYAFALWDETGQRGLLVRDPLGIKPLFLNSDSKDLTFASEAKAILARSGTNACLDPAALHLLLNFRYLPGRRSLLHGIEQLSPGAVLEWTSDGKQREHRLTPRWTAASTDPSMTLRDSVRAHLTADVEVGSYLSGGIDSATLTAIANQESGAPLRTFTLDIGDDPDEALNAARTAQLLGNPNTQEAFPDNVAETLPRLLWHLELPKVNALQVHQLARLARRHVKVVLSGVGGDELFLGYNAHRILHRAERAARIIPGGVRRTLGAAGTALLRQASSTLWGESERALLMLRELGHWPQVYGILRNVWDSPRLRARIYGPRLMDAALPNAFSLLEEMWPQHDDPVVAMAQFEWQQKMVNDLLWQEDRISMAEGLEVRVPFVDSLLAQVVQEIPRATLMPHGQPKGYMRNMVRSLLPEEILSRPKSGFQVNSPEFYHRYLRTWEEPFLGDDYVRRAGLFNPEFVRSVRHYPVRLRTRWHYFMLYLILGTHLWVELFEKRAWPTTS